VFSALSPTGRISVLQFFAFISGRGKRDQDLRKHASAILPVGDGELEIISLRDLARDRQPQAGSFDIGRRGAIEPVEDARQRRLGNADPGIHDFDGDVRIGLLDQNVDIAAGRGVTDRVVDQIGKQQADTRERTWPPRSRTAVLSL
jgi:hypothetical protein